MTFNTRTIFLLIISGLLTFLPAIYSIASDNEVVIQASKEIHAGALLIDVRSAEEYQSGFIEGAINIPHDKMEARINELGSDKDRPVVVYCKSGRRAGIAEKILRSHGFTHVINAGGYKDLKDAL